MKFQYNIKEEYLHLVAEESTPMLPFPFHICVRLDFDMLQPKQHITTTDYKSWHENPIKLHIKEICKNVK